MTSLSGVLNNPSPDFHKHSYKQQVEKAGRYLGKGKQGLDIFFTTMKATGIILDVGVKADAFMHDQGITQNKILNADQIPDVSPFTDNGIGLTFKVLVIPSAIASIAKEVRKETHTQSDVTEQVLLVAEDTTKIALAVMTCFKLGDFIVSCLSKAANAVGTGFEVFKGGISAAVPFLVTFNVIQIVDSMIKIGLDSVDMYKTSKKVNGIKEKTKLWADDIWKDETFAENKFAHLKAKQITSQENLEKLNGAVTASEIALQSAVLHSNERRVAVIAIKDSLSHRNPVVRLFGEIVPKIQLTIAEFKQEALELKHAKKDEAFTKLSEKHTQRYDKIDRFGKITKQIKQGLTEEHKVALGEFQKLELEKLDTKKSNLNLERIQIGLDIALQVVVVISLIASMVLLFTGVGTVAGIITTVTLALFITAAKYGLSHFKECFPSKTLTPFRVPLLN